MPPSLSTGLSQAAITIQNTGAPNGNAVTANSTVAQTLNGDFDSASIQVTGTYTGVLSVQVTLDNINWVTLTASTSLTNAATGLQSATIASAAVGVWQLDVSGFSGVRVTALAAMTGSAAVTILSGIGTGIVGLDTPVTLNSGTGTIGSLIPSAAPGTTPFTLNAAATVNATLLKASAGVLLNLEVANVSAAARYLRLYNKASAPTVGTDVPIAVVIVPAGLSKEIELSDYGKVFNVGIAYAITAGAPVTDATVCAAGDVQLAGDYK